MNDNMLPEIEDAIPLSGRSCAQCYLNLQTGVHELTLHKPGVHDEETDEDPRDFTLATLDDMVRVHHLIERTLRHVPPDELERARARIPNALALVLSLSWIGLLIDP